MSVSPEIVRTIVKEWVGVSLSEEEIETLSINYEALSQGLAACPDEKLKWVEPALHSATAPVLKEGDR